MNPHAADAGRAQLTKAADREAWERLLQSEGWTPPRRDPAVVARMMDEYDRRTRKEDDQEHPDA